MVCSVQGGEGTDEDLPWRIFFQEIVKLLKWARTCCWDLPQCDIAIWFELIREELSFEESMVEENVCGSPQDEGTKESNKCHRKEQQRECGSVCVPTS